MHGHSPAALRDRPSVPDSQKKAGAEILVQAHQIGVQRNGRWLIRGIDLTVRKGEIITLIGPNGSGKSTTVKTVLGVIKPDEGTLTRRPNLRIGYVPQRLAIDWTLPLTVDRLMSLTGRILKAERQAALEDVGISHLAQAEVAALSGGEFQRALLARAMARKPDLLVLDEPVQGVDVAGEAALYALIDQIRHKIGCGILLISHDLHVVMAATDTVLCLNGHMCCSGTPQSVAEDPAYLQLFGPRAASIAVYAHNHDHTHLPDGRVRQNDGRITETCHEPHDHAHANIDDKAGKHVG
ncbi:MAG: metal ABC transporter ATP-binding protein [Alphaproteobacteria bacterium]|nr:metal ABC transporter ATP-binding protein [Alphaproteobacteria bacterium]